MLESVRYFLSGKRVIVIAVILANIVAIFLLRMLGKTLME